MLFETLRAGFPADPATIAIEGPGLTPLSYGDLDAMTARLAAALAARGVRPGDRILATAPKSVEALTVYLAAIRAGIVYVPVNPGATAHELDYFRADAEPALIVDAAMLAALGGEAAAAAPSPLPPPSADALAAILYTSGTTGRPKGAMLSHGNLAANATTLIRAWGFSAADRLIHALPIFHVHGLFVASHCALGSGARMIWHGGFDAGRVAGDLARATVLMGVPTFYSRLLDRSDLTPDRVAAMRLFISGSAPLSAEVHRAFAARTGHAILERYGMTETGMLASNPLAGARVPGSVGPPLPGVAIRIDDPDDDGVGGIEVSGPNVFGGYWRQADRTAEAFAANGWFRTGDLGRFDDAGYLHIVGRAKDLVITGGLNVYPAEVEAEIDRLPGVAEAAVIGVPHPDFGEAVVAIVAPAAGARLDPASIPAALRDRLAAYKIPKAVHVVDALPRNTMGKIEKAALRQRHASIFS
ncbi:AMP-binding protein [Sphingomonas changnyeongensis]|uniref:AMP-binding protein n=1 Tax=Sphingomonas changnyeongensis TaxID=2698679 RepID=A0A7Z2NVM7_9SPHN|nr:AMP-binding protein [Sphingomonas changnyeongensis]QHL90648.1 AMP-binding protein [Sphingomonas changnyeongensis]